MFGTRTLPLIGVVFKNNSLQVALRYIDPENSIQIHPRLFECVLMCAQMKTHKTCHVTRLVGWSHMEFRRDRVFGIAVSCLPIN